MRRFFELAVNGFALWVIGMTVWAWIDPAAFRWFLSTEWSVGPLGTQRGFVAPGLGLIMLGMGVSLRLEDFVAVVKMPRPVVVGLLAQFCVMPGLGFCLAKGFALPAPLAVGLILVSACPGGTASNVIAYLSRANLPLSVLMTMCSTFAAVILTPVLTKFLAGSYMEIDAGKLLWTTVQVVLLPVVVGLVLNRFFPRLVRKAQPVFPLLSVIIIALIVAAIVAVRKEMIKEAALPLLGSVFLLHAGGFGLGYCVAKKLGYDVGFRRTLSIEVGMQNSGLGATLAKKHFAAEPMTAVPSAISAVYHCVIGSLLAAWWRRK